VGFTEGN